MCVCMSCFSIPAAVCRKLCDRTQGAEGPLGAAVRQIRRVTVERAETGLYLTVRENAVRGEQGG